MVGLLPLQLTGMLYFALVFNPAKSRVFGIGLGMYGF